MENGLEKYRDSYHMVLSEGSETMGSNFTNYWITRHGWTGDNAKLVVDLGCVKKVDGLYLRNTHNAQKYNRATNHFTVFSRQNIKQGWRPILEGEFPEMNPEEKEMTWFFPLTRQIEMRYVKFQVESYYEVAGGLHYLAEHVAGSGEGESYRGGSFEQIF